MLFIIKPQTHGIIIYIESEMITTHEMKKVPPMLNTNGTFE